MKAIYLLGGLILLASCSELTVEAPEMEIMAMPEESVLLSKTQSTKADADYWYHNKAEITSFKLEQARYGEIRQGTASFVFVTEPFSPSMNTKADSQAPDKVSVLKLNHTRKFNTGIYPYSVMTSSFFPFKKGQVSMKVSNSSQEWCGHTHMEVRNKRTELEMFLHSYFENESFETNGSVDLIEDDIWTMIRIRNAELPTGNFRMYPAMHYQRFAHIEYKSYACEGNVAKGSATSVYTMNFPELGREVAIEYENNHPFAIIGWTEKYVDGYGMNRQELTTKATRIKTINTDYWNKNSNADGVLRDELKLN